MCVIQSVLDNTFREKSIEETFKDFEVIKCVKDHFSEIGCIQNEVSIIPFIGGKINTFKSPNSESLSFEFSGCAMAQYKENGVTYAAHICLYGMGNEGDCREVWNEFIQKREITDVILFYPKTEALQILQFEKCKETGKSAEIITICSYIKGEKCYSAVIDIDEKKVIKEIQQIPLIGVENCIIRKTGKTPSSCVIL